MAGRIRIPVWNDTCAPLSPPYNFNQDLMEFHFCNVSPDINTSIQMRTNCLNSSQTDTVPHIGGYYPTHAQTAEIRTGIGLFISYHNLSAKHFAKFSDSVVLVGSESTNLENCKRMELKAYDLYVGDSLDYRYDWACVYRQPLDYPVVFVLNGVLRDGSDRTIKLTYSGFTSEGTGKDTIRIFLREDRMYPASAQAQLYDAGQQLLGQASIAYDGQLNGLFPGDTFSVDPGTEIENTFKHALRGFEISPNPFNRSARIRMVNGPGPVSAGIYDIAGRQRAHFDEIGKDGVAWDAGKMAPGIYILKAETGGNVISRNLIIIR
jgi:hypothetical protein